jgi:predicted PurR-regulated permease PerM
MVGFLIPAIADFADRVDESGAQWLDDLDAWLTDTLNIDLFDRSDAAAASSDAATGIEQWSDEVFGGLVSAASTGVSLIFSLATIAMFTFYFAADFPRLQRSFLSWFRPDLQQRLGWTIDEAIRQTGGYFYSRLLLMAINGIGFLVTMLLVGVEATLAVPLALFGSFVSVFIPAIGTYIGGAVPVLLTLAVQGLAAALIVLAYVLVYQQIENYWLSPRLSAKTMTLNGGLAFGAALGGGARFGPMGAFMALPVTALITSFIANYRHAYEIAYASSFDDDQDATP